MSRLKQPEEMPPVQTKVVYRYRKMDGTKAELTISTWRCNWRLTTRTKCPAAMTGPTPGTVRHNADVHWKNHQAANGGETK